jgi:hypothetical protein
LSANRGTGLCASARRRGTLDLSLIVNPPERADSAGRDDGVKGGMRDDGYGQIARRDKTD